MVLEKQFVAATRLVLVSLVVASATAQAQLAPVEHQGTLVPGPNAGVIRIRTDKGDVVFAGIDPVRILADGTRQGGIPEPRIVVRAISTLESIRPGMSVEFSAMLDGRKRAQEEINHITVIGPRPDLVFGLVPVEAVEAKGPGEAKGDEAAEPKKGAPRLHTVTGQVHNVGRGSLTVRVPDDDNRIEEIKVRLSPDVVVELAVGDLSLAKPGDLVKANGFGDGSPNFFATEVTITGAGVEARGKPDVANADAPRRPLREGPLLPPGEGGKGAAKGGKAIGADEKVAVDKPADGATRNVILKIN